MVEKFPTVPFVVSPVENDCPTTKDFSFELHKLFRIAHFVFCVELDVKKFSDVQLWLTCIVHMQM